MTRVEHMPPNAPTDVRTMSHPQGSPSVHLDALRGFAAFSVLISHWRDAFFADNPPLRVHNPLAAAAYIFAELGHQWVIVFFVMSGYLVGGSVLRAVESGRWTWRGYLLRRLIRLYVVLVPALLLGGVIDWAGIHMAGTEVVYSGQSGMYSLNFDVGSNLTLPTLVGNALFLQGVALPGARSKKVPDFGSNGPLWSLSNEFWYYLAFPLLTLLLAKCRDYWSRVFYLLGLVAWGVFVGPAIMLLGIPWLLGALIRYLPAFQVRQPFTRGLAIISALVLVGGGLVWSRASAYTGLTDMVLGVLVTFLIWVTLNCATAPLPSMYERIAKRSARSSYTLYLVHLPLLVFLKASLHLPRAAPSWHVCLVSLGLLAVVLVYAQIVYEVFEKNTDRVRNWIQPYVMGWKRPEA